ncbi:hypothetical protein [Bacillus sp. FMQ74]|nr:hypothetical protein [Bacillus sp. FMQ74]
MLETKHKPLSDEIFALSIGSATQVEQLPYEAAVFRLSARICNGEKD